MTVHCPDNLSFVKFDCGFYDRIGIPCGHMFALVGEMLCNMFHIHHFKMYDAFYADGLEIGEMLIDAQVSCCFGQVYFTVSSVISVILFFYILKESHERNEGNGVVLTNDQWKQLNGKCILTDTVTHSSYPMFKNITS